MGTQTEIPLIVETERGPSIAGTRITVFSVMDSLKDGQSRDLIKQLFLITDEQLSAVVEYIAANKEEIEKEYTEIVARSAKRRDVYEQIFRKRSSFPPNMPAAERRKILRQRLMEKNEISKSENEPQDSPRS
ncbi:MAG TPA: DUF433 domain-containing protein [Blastocatellia bacterium]|nr:DUF433 domain-containing protein [Blastocatellia bacterium]